MESLRPTPITPGRQRGWFGRNWPWVVPAGCLGLPALGIGVLAVIAALVVGAMKSSDAYANAFAAAAADPEVQQRLGTPINDGFFVTGSIQTTGPSGSASLAIPISGPEGEATIYAEATKTAGRWSFSTLVVEITATHESIDLND